MFVFGHLGIGRAMVRPLRPQLPVFIFLLGALLPDLIDKALYYLHMWSFVSGARTFGHTGLFLAALAAVAAIRRSRVFEALAFGVATHLVLDLALDLYRGGPSTELIALTWPFLHTHFASYDFASPFDQLREVFAPVIIVTEAVGLLLLVREYWTWRSHRTP